jgi:two-component system response regulator YesN
MIRTLIVDDEYLVRQLVKNSVNWNDLGFEIVGETEDGEQALEMVEEIKPQLMIVDINIPFINGIELSKIIRERYSEIKIIILTGYDVFEYAKEGIKAGVLNYILKPIDSEEFAQALLDVKKKIEEENAQKNYIENIVEKSSIIEKEKFLNTIICKSENEKYIKEKMDYFDISLSPDNIVVAVIVIDNSREEFPQEKELQLWKFGVLNITSEVVSELCPSIAFYGPNDQIVVILNQYNNYEHAKISACNLACEKIRNFINKYFSFTVTIGIGRSYNGYDKIYLSYQEAICAMEKKFIYGNNHVISFETMDKQQNDFNFLIFYDKDKLLIELRTGNYEEIKKGIKQIFNKLLQDMVSKDHVMLVAMDLVSVIIEFTAENNFTVKDIIDQKIDLFEVLRRKETIRELESTIVDLYEKSINYVFQNRRSATSKVVEKAKNYIEENYNRNDLTLDEIASNIFINSSYLSKVFKKELGYSVIEYLTMFRLKKAKEIIDSNANIQLHDIAERIGYSDPYYFSKCFKKSFGLPPSKYLETKNQQQ